MLTNASPVRSEPIARGGGRHRPLMWLFWLMVGTTSVSLVGLVLDDRVLVGAPIWLKPFKFSVSIGLYALTWAWMLSLQPRRGRLMWWLGTLVAGLLLIEMVIIVGQVIRGTRSHFNVETPFDAAMFSVMGTSIAVVWACNLVQAVVMIRQRWGDRPTAWGIRLGVLVSLLGMAVAFLMPRPTSDQLSALEAHGRSDTIGAHSVGVADGGAGLPVTGWSTEGGDLRIGHFIGLHALQLLPLLAAVLLIAARSRPRLRDERVRTRLVWSGALLHTGLVVLTTWQALRGQPLFAPDTLTVIGLGALVLVTGLGVVWSLNTRGQRAPS